MGGLGVILLLVGIVSYASYQNAVQLAESAKRVRHTNAVLRNLTSISETLTSAESGRRGFILFGDPDELARYTRATKNLKDQISRLRQFLSETPAQKERMNNLDALISQRLNLFQQSLAISTAQPILLPAQVPLNDEIKRNRSEIRQLIAALVAEEDEILEKQLEQSQKNFQLRMLIEILGTILTFAALFSVYALLFRQLIKRQQADASKKALEQEKELSDLKLQFFSMVSHEFRTPLSLIMGSAQLLEENLKTQLEPRNLKNLHRIESSSKRMSQMLSDVLTLARAEAGKLEFKPALIEVQTFCLNLVEDFQVFSKLKRTIRFMRKGARTHAYIDEKLVYAILSNLLSNAIKYSPPEKPVHFTLICEAEFVAFQVKDEGIGISLEDQAKLYDPFSRGSNVGGILGTGLGLALVKRCIDLHRGTIDLISEPGSGTIFTVTLPQKEFIL